MAMRSCMLLLAVVGLATTVPTPLDQITPRAGERCGYDSCTDAEPGVLNVHIVAHTHDDVGWLKTLDQYYYGSRNNIQKACVKCILNSVIKELWEDPKRKFIYVETAFFWKWWMAQPDSVKSQVHTLVRQGRLQFVGGAWSMNDEAASHYQSTVDQFTWGLQKLKDTFGDCGRPRVGWQIDPFGHSREFAANLASMGYDGLFLGRIDYQDKSHRLKEKTMEVLWRGSDDLGKSSDIFTGVLYNTYSPPPGFCFDVLCDDEPIIDDVSSPMYNVDAKVYAFLEYVLTQSAYYRTNNVLVTMGGDFTFMDAFMWFDNLDKLIKYANQKSAKENLKVKLFYSTPTCYLKAVKDANPSLPIKQDDFFPYASDSTAYWTGYFTSRPTTKRMERETNNYLQTFKMLQVLTNLPQSNMFILNELKSAMGMMQHHDAITGTEKQHVTHDYERIVSRAVDDAYIIGNQAFTKLLQSETSLVYERCEFNQSQCGVTERSKAFIVTVFNNQVLPRGYTYVELPVIGTGYSVYDETGTKIFGLVQKLLYEYFLIPTRQSNATHVLMFVVKNLPGLGYKNFYVKKDSKEKRDTKKRYDYYSNINDYWKDIKDKIEVDIKNVESETLVSKADVFEKIPVRDTLNVEEHDYDKDINWDVLKDGNGNTEEEIQGILKEASKKLVEDMARVSKDSKTVFPKMSEDEMRMLSDEPMVVEASKDIVLENEYTSLAIDKDSSWMTYTSKRDGTTLHIRLTCGYYIGCEGDNRAPANRSSGAYIFRPNMTSSPNLHTFKNFAITNIVQTEIQQVQLQYDNSVSLKISLQYDEVYLNTIVNLNEGKEYVLRIETDLKTNGVFYTDSNGRQMLKRIRNSRPQWNVTLAEPIPGNYYPIVNEIYIEDEEVRLVANVDRARGGASLKDGWFEIMQHRRLKHDDAFGVGEALNETAGGKGLYSIDTVMLQVVRKTKKENFIDAAQKSLAFFSEPQIFVAEAPFNLDKFKTMKNEYSFLKTDLPKGVHLLTLEPWKDKILIRFENYFDKELSPDFISVDLSKVFNTIEIKSIKETTLAANMWLSDFKQWDWNTDEEFSESFNKEYGNEDVYRAKERKTYDDDGLTIKLRAKEIRTFVAEYEMKKL
ncbi:LOW QUALITY PROTEIN: lysosomal alpha-mannosidase-like [Leguminivora glycinivorella]|uniref:LOW QUALITY PROTEIN: lysosomal alpha-mannosidase-like n=1 Tax=Leguminivora glycinivorella TaxID=1035111 RepID=UPI00200BA794|nr:LOW QUALITY PROTEIN: lysosomal alpha-mannosidase-like [Leguminivora glycinivorella]